MRTPNPDADHARRLRAARAYANKSRLEVAKAISTSAETIKRVELGERDLKDPELVAIAAALSVPVEFMQEGFHAIAQAEHKIQLADEGLTRISAELDALRHENAQRSADYQRLSDQMQTVLDVLAERALLDNEVGGADAAGADVSSGGRSG